jgi:hypothetical protein
MLLFSVIATVLSSEDTWCAEYKWVKDGVEHKMYYIKMDGKLATVVIGKFSMLNIHDLANGSVDTTQIVKGYCIKGVMTKEEYYRQYQEGLVDEPGEIKYSDPENGYCKSAIIEKNGTVLYRLKFEGKEENIHDIVLTYPEIKYLPVEIETPEGRWHELKIIRDKHQITELLTVFECRDLKVLKLQELKEKTPYNYFVNYVKGLMRSKREKS